MNVEIRRAHPEDSHSLTEIAHAAKRHWGYPEPWILLWKEVLTITPQFISDNETYVAVADAEIGGFYALLQSGGSRVTLEHLWLRPSRIGTGLGRALFNHAVRTASRFNALEMDIESDPNAEGFYLRMGARKVGETISMIDGERRTLPRLVLDIASHSG